MSATFYLARMCVAFFIGIAMVVVTGCGGSGGGGDPGDNPPAPVNGIATCSPASVAFGNQTVNVATAPTTVTITNTGTQELNLGALTKTGSGESAFTITQPAQLVLAPNATTTFTVIFTPTAVAAYSATVNIPVTDTKDHGTTLRVTGSGITSVNGVITVAPLALDFGTIVINETSAAQTVTVTNTGNSALTFSDSATGAVTVTGAGAAAFQVTQMGVTALAPSASATFNVVFQPLAIQQYTATVLVTAINPASSGSVTVTGIGRGPYRVDELVTLIAGDGTNMLTTGRYDFGIVEPPLTATQSFTLTNVAPDGRTVTLKQLYTTLPNYIRIVLNSQITNGGFTTTDPNPVLAGGQSTTFVMTYTSSTVERVSANANMELIGVGNLNWTVSAGMQDRLYIIGNGLPIADGDTTPRTADLTDFGSAEVLNNGTQTRIFFINNHQDPSIILADVDVTAVSPPGSFEVISEPPNTSDSSATTATIAGHGTKSFSIRFNALRLGQATATVVVRSNDVMHPNYTFAITGLALAPKISVHGVPVHFDAYTRQWIEDSPIEIVDVKPNNPNPPEYPTGKGNPPNPDNTPSATYGTFFGYNPLGNARRMKYFIRNDGNWVLRLTNTPGINFIGTMTDQFQMISAPDSTIEPGQQTTCIVEHMARFYSPQSGYQIKPGELNEQLNPTTIRIDTNDPAGQPNYIHNPFAFKINGYRNRTALTMQAVVLSGEAPYGWYNFPTISAVTGNSATTRPDLNSPPLPSPLTTAEKRIVDEYYGINPTMWSDDNGPIGPTIPHGQKESRLSNRSDFGGIQRGGVETREFIIRNDWNGEVQLSGSPLVNISGSHASDYTVELLGVYDAAGVNKAGATANSATVAQWFSNNPKPILAYHELLRYSVTFRPADLGTRTCQMSVKTGVFNVALGVTERADPVLNTPEFEQTYTAFFNGKGLGPKVQLTSAFGVGIDRNDIPSHAKTTLFGTQCFICDRATPSATSATYIITNIGNQKLSLGQDIDDQVRVIELTNQGDFVYTQPVRNGEPCLALQPGESATFTVAFSPGPAPFDPATKEEPDESLRETRVTIQTSDAPVANPQHRDGYVFTIQALAIDPRMRVRGNGQLIYDCDFSPRDTEVLPNRSLEQALPREWDDTVFRDMDMWGGQETHTFLLRNAGNKHILEILDPVWFDNEEIIRSVMPKEITGTLVQIPGLQNVEAIDTIYYVDPITYKNVAADDSVDFGTRSILRCDPVYPLPIINYRTNGGYIRDRTLNTYASVLSRVRKGDGAVVFGGLFNLVGTDPNIATVCGTPVAPLDLPAPEDILRLRQNNPENYLPHSPVDESYKRTTSSAWQDVVLPLEDLYIPEGVRPYQVVGTPWSGGEDTREGWTLSNPFVGTWRYRTDTPVVGSVTLDADAGTNVRIDPDMYIIRTSNDMTGDGDTTDANDKAFFYAPIALNRFSDPNKPPFGPAGPGDWIRIWSLPHDAYSDHFIVQDLFSTEGNLLGGYCYNLKPYDSGLPAVPRFNLRMIDIFIEDTNGLKNGGFRVNTADAGTAQALAFLKPGFTIEFYPECTDPSNGDLSQLTGVSNDPERFHYIDNTTSLPWPNQGNLVGPDGSYVSFDEVSFSASNPTFSNNNLSDPVTGFLNGAPYTVPVGTPKARPKCWSFTVESVDAGKGIIRVLQASESSFAALKSDSNWGDGPSTASASEAIVNGVTGDGLDGRIDPNNPVYYENPENGHFSATTAHTTMLSIAGNAYYQGTFVAVIPRQCDFIDSNANRVSFVKNDVTVTGYQRTDAKGSQVTPPFSLAPGEEVSLSLRVRTRWSTGFDRWNLGDDGFGPLNGWHSWNPAYCPPGRPSPSQWISRLGWDSYDLSQEEENLDASGSRFPLTNESLTPGVHPMGEHMVEVNINNTDVDTYRNKKTGYDVGPHGDIIKQSNWLGDPCDGCYLDATTPCYEFTLMLESRDPRIRISTGSLANGNDATEPYYESHHPNFWPDSSVRFAPDTWFLGSTPVGGAEVVQYLTIENGSPWLKGPTPYLAEGSAGGVGGDGYVATGIQAGLLRLDLDRGNPFVLNGPPDFAVTVQQVDANVPKYALEDRDKAAQILVPYPSPEHGSTLTNTDKIILKITFNPNVVGNRNATLTIPSNDASHPNLNITLLGSGTQPVSN